MADRMKIEAGCDLLAAMTAENIARKTQRPINETLERFMQSITAELIYDLHTEQRFLGPAALTEEYMEEKKEMS